MILHIGENEVKTELQQGDLLVFNPKRKVISIRRGNDWVIFPGSVYETSFPGDENTFAYFANLLSYLIDSDSLLSEIKQDIFSIAIINKEKCITYYV